MQTIIKLPQDRKDLTLAGIPPDIVKRLENYQSFTDSVVTTFRDYTHITDFITKTMTLGEIFYLKTFPELEQYGEEVREFICYGSYHRNIPSGHKNLFFRIDQDWEHFSFPSTGSPEINSFVKKYFPVLSGTITTDTIFPSIILDQNWLNDKSELTANKTEIENLYLFSTDYWSRNYFLDDNGDIFELYLGKLTKTRFNFVTWIENELQNFFKHLEKP